MAGIIYDSTKIKVYGNLVALCKYAGETREWCDALWQEILADRELYDEFMYFSRHNTLSDKMNCHGYTMIDLFIWEMDRYNLRHDTGKNTGECRKVDMVLHAFDTMARMKKNPEEYVRRLEEGRGNDKL